MAREAKAVGLLLDLAVVVTLVLLIAKARGIGLDSTVAYLAAGAAVLSLVALRVKARREGGLPGHAVRLGFTVLLPVLSAAYFVARFAPEGQGAALAGLLFATFLAVAGLYVMLFGLFTSPQGLLWSLPGLLSLVLFAITLGLSGDIPPETLALYLAALLVVRWVAQLLGAGREARAAFSVFIPLAGLAAFLLFAYAERGALPPDVFLWAAAALVVIFIVSRAAHS